MIESIDSIREEYLGELATVLNAMKNPAASSGVSQNQKRANCLSSWSC